MGRAPTSTPSTRYRDDDVASTSSAVLLQEQRISQEDAPPAYTDDPNEAQDHGFAESAEGREAHQAPESVSKDFTIKTCEDAKGSTTTYISRSLTSDPAACQSFIEGQILIPPRPMVRMIGSHIETRIRDKKEEKTRVTDFDIRVAFGRLLAHEWARSKIVDNAQKTYRGGIFKQVDPRAKAHSEAASMAPSLKEWCHRFCASSAGAKSFTVSRKVTDFEYYTVTNRLTEALRGTNYRGHINITYPVYDRSTIITSDHWMNRLAIQLAAESKKQGILTNADRRIAREIEERSKQRGPDRSGTVDDGGILAAATTSLLSGVQGFMMHSQNLRGWGGDC
ncbi:MAG: hypothetical protein Q9222_007383 [Ikaeria aurantiellina]